MNGPAGKDPSLSCTGVRHRLARASRLEKPGYKAVFDKGRSLPSRSFVLWILAGEPGVSGRMGTVVSKRTFPHAVQRNRARRLMREAYRLSREHVAPGVQLILLGRRRILDFKSGDVREEFRRACRKAGIWREEGGGHG